MKNCITTTALLLAASTAGAQAQEADTTTTTLLEGVEVRHLSTKEELPLGERPAATLGLDQHQIAQYRITDIKGLATLAPNLHNPDYGSRTTSAIYIRGLGSRMDQPAVGLYVDGIPYMNKSAFDFNLSGINKITVARGPQGALYGRNNMAGIIDIETRLPNLDAPLTELEAGYGTYNTANFRASHFNHIGKVGLSADGYYNRNDGFFTNHFNGDKIGEEWNAGGRLNATYNKGRFSSLLTFSYDHTDQLGYAYAQLDSAETINYNHACSYLRDLLTGGLRMEYAWPKLILSSATSFQYLDDEMNLDNDFTQHDLFTLQQNQDEKTVTEEIVLKTNLRDGKFHRYSFITGVSGFYRDLGTNSPVYMKREGISRLIEGNVNKVPALQAMGMSLHISNHELPIGTTTSHPSKGAALFHQSTVNLSEQWAIDAGIRADHEEASFDYSSHMKTHYTFPPMVTDEHTVATDLSGSMSQSFWEVLPKIALRYQWEKGRMNKMVYASAAKGYKSGGYNSQMMSDVLQYQMQKDLKEDLYYLIPEEVEVARETMKPILLGMKELDVEEALEYKPEYSWNYELGTKLHFEKLGVEAAFFFIDCRDQQVTVFSKISGMGRMMKNAGHTQSYGSELTLDYQLADWLTLNANYGFTHATYKDYQANDSTNYKGNHIPFAPCHTYMLGLTFHRQLGNLGLLTANANYSGAAGIYWTDDNTVEQDPYGTLNLTASLVPDFCKKLTFGLWGKNLTDADFNTFYFESMGNRFAQKGKPAQAGLKVNYRF